MSAKTYAQFCPVAVSLDVLGDRWTLLILRDLTFGPQRFSDLRRSLDGIAPNLLSDRLRELIADGLVARRDLPPPAARSVYVLTDDGQAVRPVLQALLRFGLNRLPDDPAAEVPARVALAALLACADGTHGTGDQVRLELELCVDDLRVRRRVEDGTVQRGGDPGRAADVRIEAAARTILDLARKRLAWHDATEQGLVVATGSAPDVRRTAAALGLEPA